MRLGIHNGSNYLADNKGTIIVKGLNYTQIENIKEYFVRTESQVGEFTCGHCAECFYLKDFGGGTDLYYCGETKIQETGMFDTENGTSAIYDINDFGCIKFKSKKGGFI